MNILDHVRSQVQKAQRLSDAQAAHLQARAYRGVEMSCKAPTSMVATIDGKRYRCTAID